VETRDILAALPAGLDWMVLFRLSAVRAIADDDTIRRMYSLQGRHDLSEFSHVVLSSAGRGLAPRRGSALVADGEPTLPARRPGEASLQEQHADGLRGLPLERSDCLGLGRKGSLPTAFLHLELSGAEGEAVAVFQQAPSRRHYDLLAAVGVEYLGAEPVGDRYLARYRNRMATHLRAGALGGFERTAHCNEFFLSHGEIDEGLAEGLRRAGADRLQAGRTALAVRLRRLGGTAGGRPLPMLCQPPPPEPPRPYGDLVPLGLLLRALTRAGEAVRGEEDALQAFGRRLLENGLRQRLLEARRGDLWAFHTGRLVTATDSALVLLGLREPPSVEALEAFADGSGGYYPQLWFDEETPGRMKAAACNRHWRQADFATSCLVRALRGESGLPERTPVSYLDRGFADRAGLYFANPFLVDWCLALAAEADPRAAGLRVRLVEEILDGANADGGFGRFDVGLSTALAILALSAGGYRGRRLWVAQLRLLDTLESEAWTPSTPFYSTFLGDSRPAPGSPAPAQHLDVGGERHELTLYHDQHHVVFTALAALALAAPADRDEEDARTPGVPHPRYRCSSLEDYLARFALPPYTTRHAPASPPVSG
jgi:hypothetical protein